MIGAGIAGLSTAYILQCDGASVVLLDDGPVGGGQTGRTTAHLSNALDDRYTELERLHGAEGARLAAASHTAAIARIEEIVRREGIGCDFARIDGFLFAPEASAARSAPAPPRTTLPDLLRDELAAARRAGVPGVEQTVRAPLVSFDTGPCLRFPNQGRFEPIRYLDGLAAAFERRGGRLYTGTHARAVTGGQDARVDAASGHRVSCKAVVVATNTPVNDRFVIHTKQAPYMTYVIAARVPHGSLPDVLLWDTEDPYHYVRLQPVPADGGPPHDLVIVGGEDHKTGQANDGERRFARLEGWTRERFPMVEGIDRRWTGQVMEPSDGAAFLGRNPSDAKNVYIATGDSGHGMTHGTIAGMLISDLIAGRPNPWARLYDPARVNFASASDLLVENLNVAAQYVDWLRPGDASSEAQIANGAGAVLRRGLVKVAVYRDDDGRLHRMSATCPHLGCIVSWNAVDRTWDCPCHGSRFACTGQVLNGPANEDLTTLDGTAAGEHEAAHGEQEQV